MKIRPRLWVHPRALPAVTALGFAAGQAANGGTETGYSPRIPDIQGALHLSDGLLGAVLLGWSLGMMTAAQLAGRWCDRFGTRPVFFVGALLYWLPFPLIGIAPDGEAYFLCLLVIGLGNGAWDVAFNVMAARRDSERAERARVTGQPPPRTHNVMWSAVFSLISVVTALLASVARQHHVPVTAQMVVITVVALALTVPFTATMPDVRNPRDAQPEPLSVEARRQLRWLVLVAAVAGFPIGAVYAWSTPFVGDLHAPPIVAGLGLDLFALCQGLVQIGVFAVSHRVPRVVLVTSGGVVTLVGAVLTISTTTVEPVVAGFALIGAGLAATFAFCTNQAEEIANATWKGRVISRVTLAAYGGLVCAQPVMGALAQLVDLRFAWTSVAVCGAILGIAARRTFRAPTAAAVRQVLDVAARLAELTAGGDALDTARGHRIEAIAIGAPAVAGTVDDFGQLLKALEGVRAAAATTRRMMARADKVLKGWLERSATTGGGEFLRDARFTLEVMPTALAVRVTLRPDVSPDDGLRQFAAGLLTRELESALSFAVSVGFEHA